MGRRRLAFLILLVAMGGSGVLATVFAPSRTEAAIEEAEHLFQGVPDQFLIGVVMVFYISVWIAGMILLGKVLFWAWQQVNGYVFWAWDIVIPESPIIRFGAGVMILLFVFIFGPLLVLQGTDPAGGDDEIEQQVTDNETADDENETSAAEEDETESPAIVTQSGPIHQVKNTYAPDNIIAPSKDPYLCV